MTDPSVDDLHYGHVGHALYDQENGQWIFSRQPGRRRVLQPLGDIEPSVVGSVNGAFSETDRNARFLDQQKRCLLSSNPQLRAAESFLIHDAQISETLDAVVTRYDPLRGDLLAFGKAADVDNKGSKGTVRVVAIPGDTAGQALRLVQERVERQGWGQDKSIWLRVPTLGSGETSWWSGNGAPIQQICFANSINERSTNLAVRTARSVHIFRPRFHRIPIPALKEPNSRSNYPASRLEVDPVVGLTVQPGEPAFADVAFNPDYQRQFATISEEGQWTVWDIEGSKRKRSDFKAVPTKNGLLEEGKSSGFHDGWHRILWAENVNTVVVCNRTLLGIFDLRGGHSTRLSASSLRLAKTPNWILDMRRDPQSSSRIILLTSTHLLVIKVPLLDATQENGETVDATILLSWRHFRDSEDISLQLSAMIDGEDTVISLRSQQDHGVTVFRYAQSMETASLPFASSDPVELSLTVSKDDKTESLPYVMDISFEPLDYGEDPKAHASGPGYHYREHGVQFYNMYMLSSNFEISKRFAFLCNPASNASGTARVDQYSISVPSWTKRSMLQSASRVGNDDFVVADDALDSEDELPTAPWMNGARSLRKNPASTDTLGKSSDILWTVDNSRVCAFLDSAAEVEKENAGTIIAGLADKLHDVPDPEEHHYDTLWKLSGGELDVSDIDETATSFAQLLRTASAQGGEEAFLVLERLGSAYQLGLPDHQDGEPSISAIYEAIISSWLSTLPKKFPGKIRLLNERLARQIATQLCLASVSLKIQQPEPHQENEEARHHESQSIFDEALSSPVKPMRRNKGRASQDFFPMASSQLDLYGSSQPSASLPTPEATPSLISGSSFSSGMSTLSDGSFARLRQYTTFSRQLPALPRQMNRLLSHWIPGADPELYSYGATRAATSQIDAMEEEGMTQKQRAKLHRKAERHLRRQRRETAAHLASQSQSNAMTPLVSHHIRSSPGPAGVGSSQFATSSQFTPSQKFPASQPVPGQFSGRPKKKIKRRMEGF